ncbi:MAG TPA: ATP-binding cassette domain-containing protein [Erysipelothrix sp.]|nr:ATP-binding cassette domain-containing protein [Erysipelothrix sp.]
MIQLNNVSKTFVTSSNTVKAVQDVTTHIKDGEIFGIIGYSGAGKSTLVRLLNLLERPEQGDVIVDGINLMDLNDKELRNTRKRIGMIFQQFNLFASRTVYENVSFALGKNHDEKKVYELLELVGIEDKVHNYPSQLSGGQKQRVAIARALANDPKVLLCDEPTSALDPQTTTSILALLKKLNKTLGITIVIITHEMSVIKEICDHVAVMEDGFIVEDNTVQEVFSNPQSDITKEFTSNMKNVESILNILEENKDSLGIEKNEYVLKLEFIGSETAVPLISDISKKFAIHASIIYGTVDVIKDMPLGSLIVILKGDVKVQEEAIEYLKQYTNVEVIIHA